jgi:hypothetical protein
VLSLLNLNIAGCVLEPLNKDEKVLSMTLWVSKMQFCNDLVSCKVKIYLSDNGHLKKLKQKKLQKIVKNFATTWVMPQFGSSFSKIHFNHVFIQ